MNHNKTITKNFLEAINENFLEYIDNEDKEEIIESLVSTDYELYDNTYVVLNMKDKGNPKLSDITKKLVKELGKEKEEYIDNWLNENFYNLWLDEVQFFQENLDYDKEVTVEGRSGGYWGFPIDDIEFEIDLGKAEEIISKNYSKEIEDYLKDYELEELEYDDFFELEDDLDYTKLIPAISLKKKSYDMLFKFHKEMMEESKDWEKPDRWVDLIIANNYIE